MLFTFFKVLFLSVLLSVDDFAVGIAYGLRKTTIPLKNLFLIISGSAASLYLFMLLGKIFSSIFTHAINNWISFILLTGLGCWTLYKSWRDRNKPIQKTEDPQWAQPANPWEYFYLGASLGVDDFAEAVGLAIAGFPVLLTVILLEVSEVFAIWFGSLLGEKTLARFMSAKLSFIPGITLIAVALRQLF